MARWIAVAALFFLANASVVAAEDEEAKLAEGIITKFFTAMREKDVAALMATVDVPWFHSGKRTIDSRDDLKQEFEKLFGNNAKDYRQLDFQVKQNIPYGSIRTKLKDEERQMLDKVLTEADRVLLVEIDNKSKKKEGVALMVRMRAGDAKVVGLRD